MKDTRTSRVEEPAGTALQSQTNPPDHILVAEDDIFFRRLNTEVLARSGYDVDAAADGAAAWQALNTGSYDLLITDNSMPKVSGVELLKKLRGARIGPAGHHGHRNLAKGRICPIPLAPTFRYAAQALYR